MVKRFIVNTILVILVFSSFNLLISSSIDYSHGDNSALINNFSSDPNTKIAETPSNSRGIVETNTHGGSWLDSFEDDSGIDWGNSNHINLTNGYIKIDRGIPKPFKMDSHTKALWHFNEGTGSTTYDETANNNDGNVNGPIWTTGMFNNALEYSGGTERVDVSNDASLNFGALESFTIEAWVKTTETKQNIICKYVDGTPGYYQLYIQNNGQVQFKVQGTNNVINRLYSKTNLTDNNWHYVAGIRNTNKDMFMLYVDGLMENQSWDPTTGAISTPGPVYIGRYLGGSAFPFNGKIDEIKLSDRPRPAWEIAQSFGLYRTSANLTTEQITLPSNMKWDTIVINKTQTESTYLNVTILNATDNQSIPGSLKYSNNGEFDISYIDSVQYPSIRLNATFTGNGTSTPILDYWGVSWSAENAWRDTFFTGSKGTSHNLTSGESDIWASPSPTEWIKYPNNPILTPSSSGWDDWGVGRCSVIYNGTGYMMWYEGKPAISNWDIGLATSTDGITWIKYSGNPVLTRGSFGNWDDEAIGRPFVLFDGTNYKMWYMGRRTSPSWRIGYATSIDGINWQKHINNPVLGAGAPGSWESNTVANPYVIYNNLIYKMWYRGADSNNNYKIGYATSYDGINWVKYSDNPILVGPSGNGIGITGICVMPNKNLYLGWYSYRSGADWMVYHATSTDGINWINYSKNPVLQKSLSGWDSEGAFNPHIIIKNRQFFMYYQGNQGGTAQIGLAKSNFTKNGILKSTEITIPSKYYWDTLIINKSNPPGTYINITILAATTNQPIQTFEKLTGTSIDLSSLNPHLHSSIKLQATFVGNNISTPILHDWSVNWTSNSLPKVLEFQSIPTIVYRTNSTQLTINMFDKEDSIENLTLDIYYKSPNDLNWHNSYLANLQYENNFWSINFTPDKIADLGEYSFNISCNDSFQEFNYRIFNDAVTVLNNPPTKPDVVITPDVPTTKDTLEAQVSNATDVEDEPLTYFYDWFKNDIFQPYLYNATVPSIFTSQNEVWKCVATPNDGNDNGTPGEAEIVIFNTAPEINNSLLSLTIYEDEIDYSIDLFHVFKDVDNDELEFRYYGNTRIKVNIFNNGTVELAPDENWFGTETITFFAKDNLEEINDSIIVKVLPTNDEPVITEIIGPKNIYLPSLLIEIKTNEDEWLNLTIDAYDIDGDTLVYSTNRTDNIGLDDLNNLFIEDNKISFLPINDDVGELYINISVSDNNGSKIYQEIMIIIENSNDPPSVQIIEPLDGSEFLTTDMINFSCMWSDIDLNTPDTTEMLTFTWHSNITGDFKEQGEKITNVTLVEGYHLITIEVEDITRAKASDSVNIYIKAPLSIDESGKDTDKESETQWWLFLIVIVIIIIIIITVIIVFKRKKQAEEAQAAAGSEALIPEIVTGQPEGEPRPATPQVAVLQQLTPTPPPPIALGGGQPSPTVALPTTPALAGAKPSMIPSLPPAVSEDEEEMSKEDKLKLLEERLAKGDIDQELYEELKQKIEIELEEVQPSVEQPPEISPTSAEEETLSVPTFPVPKLKAPSQPGVVGSPEPESPLESESGLGEQVPSPEEQPIDKSSIEAQDQESTIMPQIINCPQCQSDDIITYPDGSRSCSSCNHKWI